MKKNLPVQLALFALDSPREEARQQWQEHMKQFDRDRQERRRHGLKKRHTNKLNHTETKETT